MRTLRIAAAIVALSFAASLSFAQAPADNDHTLQSMRDEIARSKARLELKVAQSDQPVRPYFIEYRLVDFDVREVVGQFGAFLVPNHSRLRQMLVSARIGDYK